MDSEPPSFLETIDTSLVFGLTGILFLLACSAFISGAEVALFSLSQKDINDAAEKNPAKGNAIATLLNRPKQLLATILIVNNFINVGDDTFFLCSE